MELTITFNHLLLTLSSQNPSSSPPFPLYPPPLSLPSQQHPHQTSNLQRPLPSSHPRPPSAPLLLLLVIRPQVRALSTPSCTRQRSLSSGMVSRPSPARCLSDLKSRFLRVVQLAAQYTLFSPLIAVGKLCSSC